MSIRAALGAGRARAVGQLMTESMLIAGVSGAFGVALASALLKLFELYGPSDLVRVAGVGVNAWVVAFAIGVSSVASILFGLIPALTTSAGLNECSRSPRAELPPDDGGSANRWSRSRLRHRLYCLSAPAF
jgi:hypothetical protein